MNKRSKDIKCFADLPEHVQREAQRAVGPIPADSYARHVHLFPDTYHRGRRTIRPVDLGDKTLFIGTEKGIEPPLSKAIAPQGGG